jgi:hypothetical protein
LNIGKEKMMNKIIDYEKDYNTTNNKNINHIVQSLHAHWWECYEKT